jgi:hypothetical protein
MARCAAVSAGTLALAGLIVAAPTAPPNTPAPLPVPVPVPAPAPSAPTSPSTEPREATVFLKDGRAFTGVLIERTSTRVVLRIANIDTPLSADQIERVSVRATVSERYAEWRKELRADDIEGVFRLSEWLETQGRPEDALVELRSLLPHHPESKVLRDRLASVQSMVEMRARAVREGVRNPATGPTGAPDAGADDRSSGAGEIVPLLTPEQLTLIKVMELDLARPQVHVPREVAEKLFEQYADNPLVPPTREGREALLRKGPSALMELMFRLRAREFYTQVQVRNLPTALADFRSKVHEPYVLNSCATSGCHGSAEGGGRLVLATKRPNSEATLLTNFHILSQFRVRSPDGASTVALINIEEPERSPLLQMGLPRKDAIYPHPPVVRSLSGIDSWKPTLTGSGDRRAKDFVSWVRGLYTPRPSYTLDYTPLKPFEPPASGPAKPAGGVQR